MYALFSSYNCLLSESFNFITKMPGKGKELASGSFAGKIVNDLESRKHNWAVEQSRFSVFYSTI